LPDLSLVEYSVWSILHEKIYQRRINELDDLKLLLRTEWSNLDLASSMASLFVSLRESWRWTFEHFSESVIVLVDL